MRLILLGSPGAGKGTQANFITQKYRIPHISTGDIFRVAINHKTPLGLQVKAIVEKGELVPDALVIELLAERLNAADCNDGFLLDGFPRTLNQAIALQKIVQIDAVIDIDVPEIEIINRLTGRRIHPQSGRIYHNVFEPPKVTDIDDVTGEPLIQRPDDQEATVRHRLNVYYAQTQPLRDYYCHYQPHQNEVVPQYLCIKGSGSIDEIKQNIFMALDVLQ